MHHRSNPVLDADWPDPDAIRVGDEYWMIASSFNRAPGLPVLRSRDVVDWEHVTNALPALVPEGHYALPRRGSGVWAPSIREHQGTFYITYPDPDHGIFVLDAPHPAGPWSAPRLLLAGRGLIDPCPLWDEDGRTYLVHGWARSRAGVKNRISLLEVSTDLTTALSPSQTILDGDDLPGMVTLEGPKAYRHDGWYWIYAPAGGVADGYQVVFRSRDVRGPYEHRIVLEKDTSDVNGPHQGALVDDVHGNWWFLHFQDRGVFGRVTHAQPVRFDEQGWPHMGESIDEVRGRPVAVVPPLDPDDDPSAPGPYTEPLRSDDFTTAQLQPRWHWQANPAPQRWRTGDGRVDLAFAPSTRGDLRNLGAVLGQQLPGQPSQWSVDLHLPAPASGPIGTERAGLVVLGHSYAWVGLRRDEEGVFLVHSTMAQDEADEVPHTHQQLSTDHAADVTAVLQATVDGAGRVTFGASGINVREGSSAEHRTVTEAELTLLEDWQASKGHWIGAEIGFFATAQSMVDHSLDDRSAGFGPVTVRREGREI